ncbi:uncharacterized protein LOC104883032 isoform X1 [Beta vulgaris subsp. vulgaris]|uniref:uncharacterized protein LOC104883032 isoform X1 n=1 Tax=Beta vulgaris subsp. vulgaris TaxID=3555 RepID=UPI0020374E05|nr:uncharacterized protein LOC104883032 isoform X1 [Beta vulgaris subsp. vulgaris]
MKDEWLNLAISDDNIVAELLLRLKEFPSSSSSHNNNNNTTFNNPLPPSWGLRQPRSKPSSLTSSSVEKRRETRRSPTTPLSWTCGGAASPSEGCDESLSSHHQPPPSDRFRSKISASTENPTTTSGKRPRRKKTFAELKEEESSLMKERTYLKKELATLRVTLKQQRSINENLKRMKLDVQVETTIKCEANSVDERNNTTNNGISEAASSSVTRQDKVEDASEPNSSCPSLKRETSQDGIFMLPDLNMVPDEDAVVVGMMTC